jgi:hypothetical protein
VTTISIFRELWEYREDTVAGMQAALLEYPTQFLRMTKTGNLGPPEDITAGALSAHLICSPGGRFIRSDSLPRILAHWRRSGKLRKKSTS